MKKVKITIAAFCLTSLLSACFKNNRRVLSAKKFATPSSSTEETKSKPRINETQPYQSPKISLPDTYESQHNDRPTSLPVSAPETTEQDILKAHETTLVCYRFLKTINSEPDFYTLQAQLKKYKAHQVAPRMLLAMMRLQKVRTMDNKLIEEDYPSNNLADCVHVILSFDRWAEVKSVQKNLALDGLKNVYKRAEYHHFIKQGTTFNRCLNFINKLALPQSERGFNWEKLINNPDKISRLSEFELILTAMSSDPFDDQGIRIDPRDCLRFAIKLKSSNRIHQFVSAPLTQKIEIFENQAHTHLAH